ncbi:MAG: hypothetical protein FWE37_02990 [Spirochaetaceae bacterium]|nr:hypothetical protein [Spirochaetaceae bacterium]
MKKLIATTFLAIFLATGMLACGGTTDAAQTDDDSAEREAAQQRFAELLRRQNEFLQGAD